MSSSTINPTTRTDAADADADASGDARAGEPRLSEADAAVLALELQQWTLPGAKEQAVHEQLGWSMPRYYQRLNALLDDPAALRAEPAFVWSLIRRREHSRRARTSAIRACRRVSPR